MKLVEVVEGNTEFNDCYYEIKLLGMKVDSYSGSREGASTRLERRAKEIEEEALKTLRNLGFRKR